MAILVRGVEMPERCWDCAFMNDDSIPYCILTEDWVEDDGRLPDCPLVEPILRIPADKALVKAWHKSLKQTYDLNDARIFHCAKCGFRLEDSYPDEEYPRYCQRCGRKVKR